VRLAVDFGAIPEELMRIPCWVVWAYRWDRSRKEWTKVPLQASDPRRNGASIHPTIWAAFATARAAYQQHEELAGVGLVLTSDDDLIGVEIDHAAARALVSQSDGAGRPRLVPPLGSCPSPA
jgi:primase-polymerase (primpol)-like protein